MTDPIDLRLRVNGHPVTERVDSHVLLVDLLRDRLGLLGTRVACDQGACGACTVLVDDRPVTACLTFAFAVDDTEVTTIEGVAAADGSPDTLQRAFHAAGAPQCGFCTSGMVLMARAFTLREPDAGRDSPEDELPEDALPEEWLQANLCRCSGYAVLRRALSFAGLGAAAPAETPR